MRRCRLTLPLLVAAWLLLGPPMRDAAPDPDAPLARWKRYGVFASEAECRQGLAVMQRLAGKKYGWEEAYWTTHARCLEATVTGD